MRAGVIGLGVGEAHIAGYLAEGVELVALCDRDPQRLAEVGARYPGVKLYASAEQLLTDAAVDVVSIASYDWDHHEQLLMALECGKDAFVEKPLCISEQEATSIRAALRKYPTRTISSNLILRCSPLFAHVRDLIARGELGTVYHLEGEYLYGRLEKIVHGWRGSTERYSVVLGGGIHLIDLLMWMSDDRIVEVQALGGRYATRGTHVKFPDTVSALLQFESGATGVMTANFPCVHPHFHRLGIFGMQGSVLHDSAGARWYTERDRSTHRVLEQPYRPSAKHLLVSQFVRAVRGTERLAVGVEDLFTALAVCFAIERAARSGGREQVRPL